MPLKTTKQSSESSTAQVGEVSDEMVFVLMQEGDGDAISRKRALEEQSWSSCLQR